MHRHSLFNEIGGQILKREVFPSNSIPQLYGQRCWVDDLDIVNELDGHRGCINTLNWSKSGRLLASGSDDKNVIIHRYNPAGSTWPFEIATTIATGHTANIFSVKFMPHSSDRTIVTAAGDRQVRVFDIEYAGNTNYHFDHQTNARVYNCHRDRVKRIVTESSPHLFLTCSEDGDVRQWDLRQPSSHYPRTPTAHCDVPPPLISYSSFGLDINTISCSASQPHYIALGGANRFCYLHDRRMIGRDASSERGLSSGSAMDDDGVSTRILAATRCVQKFGPSTSQATESFDHITACKISDARPNELLVSWSGNHIYSFDIRTAPDPSPQSVRSPESRPKRASNLSDNALKRPHESLSMVADSESSSRSESRRRLSEQELLRIQYRNGQTEYVPITGPHGDQIHPVEGSSNTGSLALRTHRAVARDLATQMVEIRWQLMTLDSVRDNECLTAIMRASQEVLGQMKDIDASWGQPENPTQFQVYHQADLRDARSSAIRAVQFAGMIARVLGADCDMDGPHAEFFVSARHPIRRSALPRDADERFGHVMIKAIILWVESGAGALLQGFTRNSSPALPSNADLPVPPDAGIDAIGDMLIPHLESLATPTAILNVEAAAFEVLTDRLLYASGLEAVGHFASAIRSPFDDLSTDGETRESDAQSRPQALQYWVGKVARGLWANLTRQLTCDVVSFAFGGGGRSAVSDLVSSEQIILDRLGHEDYSGLEIQYEEDDDLDDYHDDDEHAGDTSHHVDDDDVGSADDDLDADDEFSVDAQHRRNIWRSQYTKPTLDVDVPIIPRTRCYKGHCNVQTVKDVNYFGLDDEYVVSGSDDGNVFIWDRKTTKLINILRGDESTVNVIQGHPYEPMLAVSGIDHTVKIFSSDARARDEAVSGLGVMTSHPTHACTAADIAGRAQLEEEGLADYDLDWTSHGVQEEREEGIGLACRRRHCHADKILASNDNARRSGTDDAFVATSVLARLAHLTRNDPNALHGLTVQGPDGVEVESCNVM